MSDLICFIPNYIHHYADECILQGSMNYIYRSQIITLCLNRMSLSKPLSQDLQAFWIEERKSSGIQCLNVYSVLSTKLPFWVHSQAVGNPCFFYRQFYWLHHHLFHRITNWAPLGIDSNCSITQPMEHTVTFSIVHVSNSYIASPRRGGGSHFRNDKIGKSMWGLCGV